MRISSLIVTAGILLAPHLAHADFDPVTGTLQLEDAAVGMSFDGPTGIPETIPFRIYDEQLAPFPDVESLFVGGENVAIEGDAALEIGGHTSYLLFDLRQLAPQLTGRRVELKVWQRAKGTIANIELTWYSGDVDALLDNRFEGYQRLGALPFQPTGRVTDDGWAEWTSGPVDFTLAGLVDAGVLSVLDEHATYAWRRAATFDPDVRVLLDGFGIYDLGEAAVPARECNLMNEENACGPLGACQFGRCTDAAATVGPKLENLDLRQQYLARRIFLIENIEGGRGPLARFGAFRDKMMSVAEEPSSTRYWTAVDEAFDGLADGHVSEPFPTYPLRLGNGICMYESEADLLPGTPTAPMVFEHSDNAASQGLQVGDVLVAIDGVSVDEWRAAATRLLRYGGDPRARDFITTPQLATAAMMAGSTLTFQRCTPATPGEACAAEDLTTVEIDFGTLMSGLYTGELPDWRFDDRTCDFRFRRPLERQNVREYSFAGFVDDQGVREVLINGVPSQYGRGGQQWFSTISAALDGSADRMLLDERTGGGGSIEAVDMMGARLLAQDEFYAMDLFPQLSRPIDDNLRSALRTCSQNRTFFGDCGNAFAWVLGEQSGGRGLASTSTLAVITGQDVSGNDFLTKLITYRTAGTRIFGPAPTYGAFGVIWQLPALPGELSGGSVQVHDTVFLADSGDTNLDFATGIGVEPDEVVLQKQSDAVAGVDTLLERARAWVRGE